MIILLYFLTCFISFAQYPEKYQGLQGLHLGSVFIISYFPVHSESIHCFWTILTKGQGHGKIRHESVPCHLQVRFPAPERMQDLLSLFLFSFYCIKISILICHLFLGFSYWDLEKPCTIWPTYPRRGAEQDPGHIGQKVHRQDRRGRAPVPFLRENLQHKISL